MAPGLGSTALALAVAAAHTVLPPAGAVQAGPVSPVAPGGRGELSVTILETPLAGTPIELRLSASAVTLPDNRLDWNDVVDVKAVQPRLTARFVAPQEAGRYEVRGRLSYLACEGKRCMPRVATVRWEVVVAQEVAVPEDLPSQ